MAWNDENITPSVTGEVDALLTSLGQRGFVFTDASYVSVTGNFVAIQMIEDTIFYSLTALNSTVGNLATSSVTLPAGTIIYGPFTGYTLVGGKVIAYKA